jgi:hypothetical protein
MYVFMYFIGICLLACRCIRLSETVVEIDSKIIPYVSQFSGFGNVFTYCAQNLFNLLDFVKNLVYAGTVHFCYISLNNYSRTFKSSPAREYIVKLKAGECLRIVSNGRI